MKKTQTNKIEKFVGAVVNNKNVEANKTLEQILKEKVSKRLYDTLKK